jgi:hypothetical protein
MQGRNRSPGHAVTGYRAEKREFRAARGVGALRNTFT